MKIENGNKLPVVLTVYKSQHVNIYREKGHKSYVVPIRNWWILRGSELLLENRKTGELIETRGRVVRYFSRLGFITERYPIKDWKLIKKTAINPRWNRKPNRGWGAYILPLDVQKGDQVYVADLIENIRPITYRKRYADDGEGVWDGKKILIDMESYNKIRLIG